MKKLANWQNRQRTLGENNQKAISTFIEKDLTFLGITGLEDSLAWNSVETIKRIRDSGIKVWICTGDKLQTTLRVAKNLDLISMLNTQESIEIVNANNQDIQKVLSESLSRMRGEREAQDIEYLTVNGESLAIILEAKEMQNIFITLLASTQTAIFVRMSPSQKV